MISSPPPGHPGGGPGPRVEVGCPRHSRESTRSGDRVQGAWFHASVLGSPSGGRAGRVVALVQPRDGLPGLAGRRADGYGPGKEPAAKGEAPAAKPNGPAPAPAPAAGDADGAARTEAAGGRRFPGGRGRSASPREHAPVGDRASGPIGLFLLCLSVYFTALVIRLFMEFRVSEAVPAALVEKLETAIQDRKFQEAYDACRTTSRSWPAWSAPASPTSPTAGPRPRKR